MRLLFLALMVGCSASTSGGVLPLDGSTTDDTAVVDDKDSSTTTTDAKPDTSAPSVALCQMTCSTGADCTQGSAAFDTDNYACESGVCRYKGCNSDAECVATYMSDKYICRDIPGGIKQCVQKCTTAANCATASAAYDADNWTCDSGACRYSGCNSDSECSSVGAGYVCRKSAGLLVPVCQKSCTAARDCATASAAYDEDNYACESGLCRYIGCKTDEECRSSVGKPNYACR